MKISRRILSIILTLVLLCSAFSVTAFADDNPHLMYGIGFVKGSFLRLRSEPSTTSTELATASGNECIVIVEPVGDWYKVIYNLQEGYMYKDYLTVSTTENAELGYGMVSDVSVNLRQGPGTNYDRVATASLGEKCYILGLNQGWYKVCYGNDLCYIRSDFLKLTEIPYENKATTNTPNFLRTGAYIGPAPSAGAINGTPAAAAADNTPTATGALVLSTAQKYLGCPYVSGGATPSGFDCSGFVYYVLKCLGYSPARTPVDQYAMGASIEKANLQPGDIVFFANTGATGISHVGIYAGNGQFIHAPNSRSTVSYSDLTTGYWSEHYYGARRVV